MTNTNAAKKLATAINAIADFLTLPEERVSRDGEAYTYNQTYFSMLAIVRGIAWQADRRLVDLHSLETVDRNRVKTANVYGLPYAIKRLEAATRASTGGEIDMNEIAAAEKNLDRCEEEIAMLTAVLDTAAQVLEDRTGTKFPRTNLDRIGQKNTAPVDDEHVAAVKERLAKYAS